jgi:signal transduction histidine kinase/ligand-binding sensor domain-containing protein
MNAYLRFFVISLLLVVGNRQRVFSQQDDIYFEQLSAKQGLSGNHVTSIWQDKEGFMWFGTRDGLNKFDGYHFTVFQTEPGNPKNSIEHNWVTSIYEDRKGELWLTTFGGGLHKVDKQSGKFTVYWVDSAHSSNRNSGFSIYEDQKGILWIPSQGGLNQFNPQTFQYSLFSAPEPENTYVYAVCEDRFGTMWAATSTGLYEFDRLSGQYQSFPLETGSSELPVYSLYPDAAGLIWMVSGQVKLSRLDPATRKLISYPIQATIAENNTGLPHSIAEDATGRLWIATNDGLHRFDKKTGQFTSFRSNAALPGTLSNNIIRSVFTDRTGILWVGTRNGINQAGTQPKKFRTYQVTPDLAASRLPQNHVSDIYQARDSSIWLGNFYDGLYRFDIRTGKVSRYQHDPGDPASLRGNKVEAVFEDSRGVLWVGAANYLHALDRKTGKFTSYPCQTGTFLIREDIYGKLWIAGRGVAAFDPQTKTFRYYLHDPHDSTSLGINGVSTLLTSRSGAVWVACYSRGISKLDQTTGKFTHYDPNRAPTKGCLNDKDIQSLYEDANGILWAGGYHNGLNRFDPATGTSMAFTTRDGLPNNHISSIQGDASGNLWLATHRGICRFNPLTKECRNYDQSDGLQDNEFHDAFAKGVGGQLIFGGSNGFNVFYPDSIHENRYVPPVYITGFKVMDEPRNFQSEPVTLSYRENLISFDFVAINYEMPEKSQYAYQLIGVDDDWVYSGNRRYANYTNLEPGEYVFKVKGTNNDAVWNTREASLRIVITPPFWKTLWFKLLVLTLASLLIYSIYAYRVRRIKKQNRRLEGLVSQRTSELENALAETERQRQEAQNQRQIALEANRFKSELMSITVHDLKNPLAGMMLYTELIKRSSTDAKEVVNLSGIIKEAAQSMFDLLSNLLKTERAESNQLKPQKQLTNLALLARNVIDRNKVLAGIKQQHIQASLAESCLADVDTEMISEVFDNLVSNAIKYSLPEKTIWVNLFEKGDSIRFQVKDEGQGLSREDMKKIFGPFQRLSSKPTGEEASFGLGLYLVRKLLELHGGKVWAHSEGKGKGAVFTVELPTSPKNQLIEQPGSPKSGH